MTKKIMDMDLNDRPREKLISFGSDKLSDSELLAILISTGTKEKNSIELAEEIFQKFSSEELLNITCDELSQIKGIKTAKAATIVASIQLGKRINQKVMEHKSRQIRTSSDIYDYFKSMLQDEKRESFVTILLNTKNHIIGYEVVSLGDLNSSIVNPREVFLPAVKRSAKFVAFVHNHPSGDPTPSEGDFLVTRRLVNAGDILDIQVVDHVIIGRDRYYSFKDAGRI